jgi:hypothetical protein
MQEVTHVTQNYADLQRLSIQRQLTGDRDRQRAVDKDDQRSADRGFDLLQEARDPQPDLMALRIGKARERRQAVMLVEAEYRAKATELHADPNRLKIAHDEAIRAVHAKHPLEP